MHSPKLHSQTPPGLAVSLPALGASGLPQDKPGNLEFQVSGNSSWNLPFVLLTQAPGTQNLVWNCFRFAPAVPVLHGRWTLLPLVGPGVRASPQGTSRGLFLVYLGRIERMKKNLPYAGRLTVLVYTRTLEGKQCYSLVWSKLSKWESSRPLLLSQ